MLCVQSRSTGRNPRDFRDIISVALFLFEFGNNKIQHIDTYVAGTWLRGASGRPDGARLRRQSAQ